MLAFLTPDIEQSLIMCCTMSFVVRTMMLLSASDAPKNHWRNQKATQSVHDHCSDPEIILHHLLLLTVQNRNPFQKNIIHDVQPHLQLSTWRGHSSEHHCDWPGAKDGNSPLLPGRRLPHRRLLTVSQYLVRDANSCFMYGLSCGLSSVADSLGLLEPGRPATHSRPRLGCIRGSIRKATYSRSRNRARETSTLPGRARRTRTHRLADDRVPVYRLRRPST